MLLFQQVNDSIPADSIPAYQKSRQPTYNPRDRLGDPLSDEVEQSSLINKDPFGLNLEVEVDTSLNYSIYERMNGIDYRAPTIMTFEEYSSLVERQMIRDYWKTKAAELDGESAISGKRLIPKIPISPVFDRIFGGSFVDIQPNGSVTLDFGYRNERIFNPAIPIRRQKQGTFDFDQRIGMNVIGKIGEKLRVTANFDNNTSFDFENDLRVEYTGFEEDIIKKIEIGNVSMGINNSLIRGSQNLFGVKTELQFGKLFVTGLFSTQRGSTDAITIEGGSQAREFEYSSAEYDENRHFFLGQYFRDNYNSWLSSLPQIISRANITRVEIYVLNRNNDTETLRNFAAYMDLGEGQKIDRTDIFTSNDPNAPNNNGANNLLDIVSGPEFRDVNTVSDELIALGLNKSADFEVIRGARKLNEREFTVNKQLGYISLFRKLQNDEVLAVAYEYNINGQNYKVGELSDDYANRPEDEVIFLKLLRPGRINTTANTWDLMMKNVYSLNANQVAQQGFQLRIIYRDDKTGQDNPSLHEGVNTKNIPLVELFGLDQLNSNLDPQPDGNFDFVDGLTIDIETGNIIFPVLEPFGSDLEKLFTDNEQDLKERFVFNELYEGTQNDAQQNVLLNKFFIKGELQAGSSNEIVLPGINIAENSVTVTAGNTILTEGVHYRVDYNLGKVIIIDEGIMISGKQINISYEKADLFNFQTRSLMGTRLDYRFNDDVNLGATLLYLNERPLISRISVGSEPVRNLKWGLDFNYRKESRFLTELVDALPLISTKEPSNIVFNAEFAQLLPGTSNKNGGEGIAYLEDFEAAVTPFNLSSVISWKLASTPETDDGRFGIPSGNNLTSGYKRAKISWYVVDNVFYRSNDSNTPENIDTDNHYSRSVIPQEIFTEQDRQQVNINLPILDIAYFPEERGPYNYNPNILNDGTLPSPEENWGGLTRAITSDVDFDKTNIEFVEFWLMDPFIDGPNGRVLVGDNPVNNTDLNGKLILNLGSISEDVIPDDSHGFENGMPPDGIVNEGNTNTSVWGRTTRQQFLTNAFDNSTSARENQDIGLDGVNSEAELNDTLYTEFKQRVALLPPNIRQEIEADISGDDFSYFLDAEKDAENQQIVERYQNFNNYENNSPVATSNSQSFIPSGSNFPENEDLNIDNTISDLEEYYEYNIDLNPGALVVGNQNIQDKVTNTINGDEVSWYLFRIPVRQPDRKQGGVEGFKSIRYMRMYMTGFTQPVVLRMADFHLVGSQWRRYTENLEETGFFEDRDKQDPKFTISVVSVEKNPGYVVPPGFQRDRDNTSTLERRLNEQSIELCVEDLPDRDAKAVFKNVDFDLINYGRIKMFLHAESQETEDDELTAFLRIGTDFTQNYYEIQIPLKMTPDGSTNPRDIWPLENEIDLEIDALYQLKSLRNRLNADRNLPFPQDGPQIVGRHGIRVLGNPDMSTVYAMMIGIRNPESLDSSPKSVCIWANELRVSDFDQTAGWAANASLNMKLADLGNLTASVRHSTFGFGSIQDRISMRSREEITEYDISTNLNLDKFLPEKFGLNIPMFASYQKSTITPQFDPRDPDITLDNSLASISDEAERERYKKIAQDNTTRRSLNFTNVRKIKTNPEAPSKVYDIENFSFTYAFSDITRHSYQTETYQYKSYRGAMSYTFTPKEWNIAPLQNTQSFSSPYLKMIKDINFSPIPSNFSFRADVDRRFIKTQLWGVDENNRLTIDGINPNFEKTFTFSRIYNLRWNLSRNLSLDYSARALAIVDEPDGELDTDEKRQAVKDNLLDLGRLKDFDQTIALNYRLPLDKIPMVDWMNADLGYHINYTWSAGAFNPFREANQKDTLGNIIQNNRDRNITSRMDLVKLYNKIAFLKELNQPPARAPTNPNDTTVQESRNGLIKVLLRTLMSLRSINATYSKREGTIVAGFMPDAHLFGLDQGFNAPGWSFVLGSQSLAIKDKIIENDWLAPSPFLTQPFGQSNTVDLNITGRVEPLRDLRIDVSMRKIKSAIYNEIFRFDDDRVNIESFNPTRTGSYSISYFVMGTTFKGNRGDNSSPVFEDFENNISIVQQRLESENANPGGTYGPQSQDVLIPAFIAAYAGKDPNTINLTPFPKTPLPNWRLDYAGLSKIPKMAEIFSSVNLTHSYTSTYDVIGYTASGQYLDPAKITLDNNVEDYPLASVFNDNGEWVPLYIVNQVAITERFAPLIGINLRTKSRLDFRIEYRRERNLALQLSNAQVTELNRKDFVVDIGYRKAGFKIPWKMGGKNVTLENDLTFRLAMSVGDSETIQRKIEESNTITSGNLNFQLSPTVSYVVNDRLQVQLYFERNINEPKVTNSFKRATTRFGTQISFSLAQ
jgi:cell surface protein SprA